jgi:hypothetical protein
MRQPFEKIGAGEGNRTIVISLEGGQYPGNPNKTG